MLIRLVMLTVCVVPWCAHADSFDIKPGAWDVTVSTALAGMPIPKDELAKMPADERARIEAFMHARAGKVEKRTERTCVTKADIDRDALMQDENPGCKRNVITKSARVLEFEETCGGPSPSKTHAKFEAPSPAAYTGKVDRTMGEGGEIHIAMVGKWVAAACSNDDD